MPDDDRFDAVEAAAELDEALSEEGRPAAALEADLVALHAELTACEGARQAAEARAERAEQEITRAQERLAREADRELARRSERVLLDMLGVLDDFDRALEAAGAAGDGSALARGVELVRRSFLAALARHDVFPIRAAGEPFDPELHEAVSVVGATHPGQAGRVHAVLRAGYRIGDKLLRPATVVVAR